MSEKTAIVRQDQASIEPQALLQAAIEKGASVETLERLLALTKEVRAEIARDAFNNAMAEFQKSVPVVKKSSKASIGGKYSYNYAPIEAIMGEIAPVMAPLGLSVSYQISSKADSVTAIAVISHRMGHSKESGAVTMPVVVREYGANAAQCVGIAMTYAKRYALLAVTGITPEGEDSDGEPSGNGKGHSDSPAPAHQAAASTQPSAQPQRPQTAPTTAAPASDGPDPEWPDEPPAAFQEPARATAQANGAPLISDAQARRMYAIAKSSGWNDQELKACLKREVGTEHTREVPKAHYERLCKFIEESAGR